MENEKRTITGCNEEIVKRLTQQNEAYLTDYDRIQWDEGVKILKESKIIGVDLIDEPVPDGLYLILKRPNDDIIAFLIEPAECDDIGIPGPILAGVYTLQEGKGCKNQN